jgi:hypothetical protein
VEDNKNLKIRENRHFHDLNLGRASNFLARLNAPPLLRGILMVLKQNKTMTMEMEKMNINIPAL